MQPNLPDMPPMNDIKAPVGKYYFLLMKSPDCQGFGEVLPLMNDLLLYQFDF